MIIVQQPSVEIGDKEILQNLGFKNVEFLAETTLGECILPSDKSMNIGLFNNCIIITDDYQLTTAQESPGSRNSLTDYEQVLCRLFPDSEILTVTCHSVVDFHLYSLVKNGLKLRYKLCSPGSPISEFGERIKEEEAIYANSRFLYDLNMFKDPHDDSDEYNMEEALLMEEFAFGIAKRHLGAMISTSEEDELMNETSFKKYRVEKQPGKIKGHASTAGDEQKRSWFSRLFK